jgi:hypothetical protein
MYVIYDDFLILVEALLSIGVREVEFTVDNAEENRQIILM